jgi:SAM-dependent methyltransferase
MNIKHLSLLICPVSLSPLRIARVDQTGIDSDHIISGVLGCDICGREYPIIAGIPRFVSRDNYASGFGLEWTKHALTQYDSYSGIPASENRFYGQTHWDRNLSGEYILEVGSGSGRFTEHAALTGATVVSLDYSFAVEANYRSNGHHENVLIVQGDIFNMPFARNFYDKVFCFGVLQHTPDPKSAFMILPHFLKSNGLLCADIYKATLRRTLFNTKHYVRPFTRRVNPEKLYAAVVKYIDFMWPLASLIRKIPKGHGINWRLLIADYSSLGLKGKVLKEWAYLDTFDMLSPKYDRHVSEKTFKGWVVESLLIDIETELTGHGVVVRARKA